MDIKKKKPVNLFPDDKFYESLKEKKFNKRH